MGTERMPLLPNPDRLQRIQAKWRRTWSSMMQTTTMKSQAKEVARMMEGNILIVEDEGVLAFGLKKKLERLGYSVLGMASTGEEAIEMAAKYNPDLILMDIVLSGRMDGIEASKKIQGSLDIPIVYLTAFSDEETLRRALITEPFGYLLKPYNERELEIIIELTIYRKKIEKLKKGYHWLETVLRSIGDAVIAADRDGVVAFLNPAAEKLIGRLPEEVIGHNLEEVARIIDQEEQALTGSILNTAMTERNTATSVGSTFLLSSKGEEIPVDYSASPLIDDQETTVGVVLIVKDLTLQRMMEIETTMREMVMASSINALCITNLDGKIKYANEAFYRLWGIASEDVIGRQVQEICMVEDELSAVIHSLKEKAAWSGEMTATRKDGAKFPLRLEANRIDDKFGRSISNMYSFLDITELKKAREELKKYMVKLDRTDKKTEEITENLGDEVSKANDHIEKLGVLSSGGTLDLTDKETAELLSEIRSSIKNIATLKDRLVESSLPLSLYIYLAELSRMKIEDFHE